MRGRGQRDCLLPALLGLVLRYCARAILGLAQWYHVGRRHPVVGALCVCRVQWQVLTCVVCCCCCCCRCCLRRRGPQAIPVRPRAPRRLDQAAAAAAGAPARKVLDAGAAAAVNNFMAGAPYAAKPW